MDDGEDEDDTKLIVRACLYIIPTALHVVGMYFLVTLKNLGTAEDQRLYLKHLSMAEIMICIFKIATHVVDLADNHSAAECMWVFQTTLFFTVYILILAALTVDRFLSVYLNLKYPRYVTRTRVHATLIASWSVSAAITVLVFTMLERNERRYYIVVYLWPTEEAIFLAIAVPTYFYIFAKLHRNRSYMKSIKRQMRQLDSNQHQDILISGAADLAQMPLKLSLMPSSNSRHGKKKESTALLKCRLKSKKQCRKSSETVKICADEICTHKNAALDNIKIPENTTSVEIESCYRDDNYINNNDAFPNMIVFKSEEVTKDRNLLRRKHGMQIHRNPKYVKRKYGHHNIAIEDNNNDTDGNEVNYNRRGTIKTRRRSTLHRLTQTVGNSLLKRKYSYMKRNKAKRRFFIPVLLIATFVLFWIIPDLVKLSVEHNGSSRISHVVAFWINISYVLAVSSDALIYILGIPAIHRRLVRSLRR